MDKTIRISSWASILFFLGAFLAWGAYQLIGQEVDAQGVLREPFFLIPLTWFLIGLGLLSAFLFLLTRMVKVIRKKD